MSSSLAAAFTFASHNDWARAVPAAREALASEPQNAGAHALLALGLAHLDQAREAVDAGRRAVALDPELAFAHYALGWSLLQHEDAAGAERAAREALRLDPDGDAYALLAHAFTRQRRWQDALDAAERGLEIDADHPGCANVRVMALGNLGRVEQADAAVADALGLDPNDAIAHANRGWLLLRESDPDAALDSFRTALRIEPGLEWARAGIVEALKARKGPYRLMLKYSLWMSTLSGQTRWMLIIGLFVGSRILRGVARQNPDLAPVIGPVLVLYTVFCIATWIADPLSNLLLRLNRFGRLVLSKDETLASNLVGACLLLAAIAALLVVVTGTSAWLIVAISSGVMVIPIGGAFAGFGTRAWPPLFRGMSALGACAAATAVLAFVRPGLAGPLFLILIVGVFAFGWYANYLLIKFR